MSISLLDNDKDVDISSLNKLLEGKQILVLIFCSGTFVNLLNFAGQDLDLNHDAVSVPENETTASRIHSNMCFAFCLAIMCGVTDIVQRPYLQHDVAKKFYSDSESELELSISIDDFLDFFFIDSRKSFTKTLGGTMSPRN